MSDAPAWCVGVIVPPPAVAAFEAALAPLCDAVSLLETGGGNGWRVEGITRRPPDRVSVDLACRLAAAAAGIPTPAATIFVLKEADWIALVQADMPAVTAGRFVVYGSHLDASVAHGHTGLRIDAAQAFGSGHHPSTAGCLRALSRLGRRRLHRALDLGCGSGVLAIAIAKTWRARVTAVDIDPRAVEETAVNARGNGVAPHIRAIASDGIGARVRAAGPFDLVVANILARPLKRLAGDVAGCLTDGAWCILAGFLTENAVDVRRAYAARGLKPAFRIDDAGWTTLAMRR